MFKIAITGKANSGKNTISKLIYNEIKKSNKNIRCKYIAFADPIKAMIRLMFPELPEKYLTGPSFFRSEIIPGAFKDGNPLTVRQLLIDLGTGIGRNYKESIWLDAFYHTYNKSIKNKNMIIVTDVRFKNEFDLLKQLGFYQIKLIRNNSTKINHISETNQDSILDSEYNYIINNNGTLLDLKKEVTNIVQHLTC